VFLPIPIMYVAKFSAMDILRVSANAFKGIQWVLDRVFQLMSVDPWVCTSLEVPLIRSGPLAPSTSFSGSASITFKASLNPRSCS
jgi:hypothetical protein